MRKRIVIALLVVVVVGVVALVLLQPKKGSVEWHKREYLSVRERIVAKDVGGRLTGFFASRSGMPLLLEPTNDPEREADIAQLEMHEKALIAAGFMERQIFVLTNGMPGPTAVLAAAAGRIVLPLKRTRFVVFKLDQILATNQLIVVSSREDAQQYEKFVREAAR